MTNEWDRDRAWPGNSLSHLVYVVQRCAICICLITHQDLCFKAYIAVYKACPQLVLHQSLNTAYNMSLFCFPAPSTVSIMHQVSRTIDSITLSWSQPDQPNGVILDYELQYYEKVPHKHTAKIFKKKNAFLTSYFCLVSSPNIKRILKSRCIY